MIIIDPLARAAGNILTELRGGTFDIERALGEPVLKVRFHTFLHSSTYHLATLQATLLSFYEACVSDGPLRVRVREVYEALWKGVCSGRNKDHLSQGIFLVQSGIAEVRSDMPFAQEVSYHYPYREDTLRSAYLFAMNSLLPGGRYKVATEMYEDVPQDKYDKPYDRKDFVSQLKALAAENDVALGGAVLEVRSIDRAKDVSHFF